MVRFTFSLMLACILCLSANVADAQFSDNFDSYSDGQVLNGVNGWGGWGGDLPSAATVSNAQSNSAPNSLRIENFDDAVNALGAPTSGCWEFSCQMYIPSDTTGMPYFIMLNQYSDADAAAGCANCVWSIQLQFDAENGLLLDDYDASMNCNAIVFDQWFEVRIVFDLDNDQCSQFVNGVQLGAAGQVWSERSGTIGVAELAVLDLFSNDASDFFVDDISFVSTATCDLGPGTSAVADADTITRFRGVQIGGADADYSNSDDSYALFNPGFVLNDTEAPVWLIFEANVAPFLADFVVESNAGTPGLTYTVELWNYVSGTYEVVAEVDETFNVDTVTLHTLLNDATINNYEFDVDGDGMADFPGCPQVRSRVGWRQTGFTINFPWEVRVDQAGWQLTTP